MRSLRIAGVVTILVVSYVLFMYWRGTPRLSGAELTVLESQARLKGGAYLMQWNDFNLDGSDPEPSVWGKEVYFRINLPNKIFSPPNLNKIDTQRLARLGHQLAAHSIVEMLQDSELTVFMDSHGNRYARWHNDFHGFSPYTEDLKSCHLVGQKKGGWLVYRLDFAPWLVGRWKKEAPG